MISSPIFRFLSSAGNPFGFDAVDFIVFGLAILMIAVLLLRERLVVSARKLANQPIFCMALLGALPIVLRLALLVHHPIPTPRVADDFSYLLLGDTLAHFRLANPMHPMHKFFEAVFVLQVPSYSSIYPIGQGLVLAFGQLIFRQPWIGVVLSVGALCALCYWMLRAWTTPTWALLGGLLAAIEFGPLGPWMNTYWGGAVSGIAGCLVFGALPGLRQAKRTRDAVLLGIGLSLQLLTRPFEFVPLVAIVLLYFAPGRLLKELFSLPLADARGSVTASESALAFPNRDCKGVARSLFQHRARLSLFELWRSLMIATGVLLAGGGLMVVQNKQVTGNWTTLPYQLSRWQYGVPATFTFQANPIPHLPLTPEQQVDYDAQVDAHGKDTDTVASYVARLGSRVRFYRFFFLAPLYLALPAFLLMLRQYRFAWVLIALGLFWLGDAFYPYFYPHYIAVATCLFVLVSVKSLERLNHWSRPGIMLILILCLAHFAFWYSIQMSGNRNLLTALSQEETGDVINYGDAEGRIAINDRLTQVGGKQLVFVRYSPQHGEHDWIHNAANIDGSRVVWALDLGPEEDQLLERYYPDRQAWLLEPDARPPQLTLWSAHSSSVPALK
jgi:hypothetical protein